jgi:ariadne-1
MICFDEFRKESMHAAPCRHYFCGDCWRGYISNAISCGPACLDLRCPLPDCKIAVRCQQRGGVTGGTDYT